MPSSIPYNHPSLVLGNVADTGVLDLCSQIQQCNNQIDIAQDTLNSLITMKRSLSMTLNEIADMGIETDNILKSLETLDGEITQAALVYITTRIQNEQSIQAKRVQLSKQPTGKSVESPIDFTNSKLIDLPLASESIKFDSQYFSFGSNMQDDAFANIEKFVKQGTSETDKSNSAASAASQAVQNQFKNHSIAGTLIITASCTFSKVKVFSPIIVDADKAVTAWNTLNSGDAINTELLGNSQKSESTSDDNTAISNSLPLITGACYGASFVGMIHILKSETSNSSDVDSIKKDMEQKLKFGGWLENAIGGYGVNAQSLNEVKAMLDTKKVSSHISIITTGSIPSFSSSKLSQNVNQIIKAEVKVPVLDSDSNTTHSSTASEAKKAREFAQLLSVEKSRTQSVMNSLSRIDYEANQNFDINSLIDAFDNFVADKNPNKGVPIGFYLKHLSKKEIEILWNNKYYPADNSSVSKPNK
jgi:hypothetical protein